MELKNDFKEQFLAIHVEVVKQQESAASMMYRLMFRHVRNINILDKYADQVLEGLVGIGSKFAEEDYLNYLQYLYHEIPDEYESHKRLYEFDKQIIEDKNDD